MERDLSKILDTLKTSRFKGRDTRFDKNTFGGIFFEYTPNRLTRKDKRFSMPTKLVDKITYDHEFIPLRWEQTRDEERVATQSKLETYYALNDMLEILQNDPRFVMSHALAAQRRTKNTYRVLFYSAGGDSVTLPRRAYAYLRFSGDELVSMKIKQVYSSRLFEVDGPEIRFFYRPAKSK